VKALDRTGFDNITFRGQYPIGYVQYRDDALPVAVDLEAFSPFIPLNYDDSSLPATVMRFTVKNTGNEKIEVDIAGWLENAVCLHSKPACTLVNRIERHSGATCLECRAEAPEIPTPHADIVFEDFEDGNHDGWTVTGDAFGSAPVTKDTAAFQARDAQHQGEFFASSLRKETRDRDVGTLTSKPFKIERDCIAFMISGGEQRGRTCLNLLVDGKLPDVLFGDGDWRPARPTASRWAASSAARSDANWRSSPASKLALKDGKAIITLALRPLADSPCRAAGQRGTPVARKSIQTPRPPALRLSA